MQHGQPLPVRVVVTPISGTGTPTGDFALETDKYGTAYGGTLSNGVFDSSVTTLPGGQYNLTAHYGGDAMFSGSASSPIPSKSFPSHRLSRSRAGRSTSPALSYLSLGL